MAETLIKALVAAQKEMGDAKKGSTNPYFKSKYADLNSVREACLPVLNSHGIAVIQPIVTLNGKNYVKTVLLHESGESTDSLTEIICARPNDAQAQGSGITYARRYGLQSLVNIGAEDDDGNAATEEEKPEKGSQFFKKELGPLGRAADDEEMKRLKEQKKEKSAEEFFMKAKAEFEEEFGSLGEIQSLELKYQKKLEALAKYPALHNLLTETIDAAKMQFIGIDES